MSTIAANVVKELREITGAGMMDCKRALTECAGDMEAAKDWLRKKGQAIADKKAARQANEGLVFLTVDDAKGVGAMLELNCETDFVARNEAFPKLGQDLLAMVMAGAPGTQGGPEELLAAASPRGEGTVAELLKQSIANLGENIGVGAFARVDASAKAALTHLEPYVHALTGKLGVIVQVEVGKAETKNAPAFKELCHDLALQVASAAPVATTREAVPAETVEREKAIYREMALNEGKPEAMLEKIAEGRIGKFYKQSCLMEQEFVKNPDESIGKLVERVAKEVGDTIKVVRFERIKIGA